MPKFKCSFSITLTEEKTYVITNYEVDIPDEDCRDVNGIVSTQTIKDNIADEIYDDVNLGKFDPAKEGELIETYRSTAGPDFIKAPVEVKPG